MNIRALIVESDSDQASILASHLAPAPGDEDVFEWAHASRLSSAVHLLAKERWDAVALDLSLPQSVGIEGLLKLRAAAPQPAVVALAGASERALGARAVELGAQDFIVKGSADSCRLKTALSRAIVRKRLEDEIARLRSRVAELEGAAPPRVEEELRRLEAEARERLRLAESKSLFMSRVSHELRNTLATLKTAIYCLRTPSEELSQRQARLVDMISRNVDRQGRIVDNILDLARFRSGRLRLEPRALDTGAAISEIVQEYALTASDRRLAVDVEEGLPPVEADPCLVAQVLRNLLDNALRYSREKVAIRARREEGAVAITVADDGPGVPEDRLGELFVQFSQPSPRPAGAADRGTGLGLAICREIVEAHGGRIRAENAAGRGARFIFTLPAAAPREDVPCEASVSPPLS